MTTRLHYSDVLTGLDGRLVSLDGVEGMYHIYDAVAGPGVTTLAIAYLGNAVKAELRRQFPTLARPEVRRGRIWSGATAGPRRDGP